MRVRSLVLDWVRGRSLVWPGELDLCADAIWLKATGEKDDAGAIAS